MSSSHLFPFEWFLAELCTFDFNISKNSQSGHFEFEKLAHQSVTFTKLTHHYKEIANSISNIHDFGNKIVTTA